MDLLEIRDKASSDMRKCVMSSKVLCRTFRFLDEGSRKSVVFSDDTYIPFYYHFGKYVAPCSLFRYGFGLGFLTGSFLQGCHTVDKVFAFRPKVSEQDVFSCKLGAKNLRDVYRGDLEVYVGSFSDKPVQERISLGWDIVMIDTEAVYDDIRYLLDVLWRHVSPEGLMLVERAGEGNAACRPFHDFCTINRLDPVMFETRYGTGLVRKR